MNKCIESIKLPLSLKKINRDFPGVVGVKDLPCNTGDAGLIPGPGIKAPHAAEQLSSLKATSEPSGAYMLQEGLCATMKDPKCCN